MARGGGINAWWGSDFYAPSLTKLGAHLLWGNILRAGGSSVQRGDIVSRYIDLAIPKSGHGAIGSVTVSSIRLNNLIPNSVEIPRECTQPDTFSRATLSHPRQPRNTDPMGEIIERMGELPTETNGLEIENPRNMCRSR